MIPRRENFECVVKYYQISYDQCQIKLGNFSTDGVEDILQAECPQDWFTIRFECSK